MKKYGNGKGKLMTDVNQYWASIDEGIEWMLKMHNALVKKGHGPHPIYWIEEPSAPLDILGHRDFKKAMDENKTGIQIATGEVCPNALVFEQFMRMDALGIVQPDTCRLNSAFDLLAVLLTAKKFKKPVCFHAGGVGLNEYVRHWAVIDYVLFNGDPDFTDGRLTEYAQHFDEKTFFEPAKPVNGTYRPPKMSGYSRFTNNAINTYVYPHGLFWKERLSIKSKI